MKIFKYEPSLCKGDGVFKGYVMLEIPSYPQRLKYIKECHFQVKKSENGIEVSDSMANIDALIKMVELAKIHVKEVHITKDGYEYKDFEDMLSDADCDELNNDIAGVILNGIKLGKN
jgi:hypothetical protein